MDKPLPVSTLDVVVVASYGTTLVFSPADFLVGGSPYLTRRRR